MLKYSLLTLPRCCILFYKFINSWNLTRCQAIAALTLFFVLSNNVFGHTKKRCRNIEVCKEYGTPIPHDYCTCKFCINCQLETHPSCDKIVQHTGSTNLLIISEFQEDVHIVRLGRSIMTIPL